MEQRSGELPEEAWREITVAEGSQGPRSYRFSAQRVRPTSRRKPGEIHWGSYRRNLDGSEPRYYLSNAPEDTPLETLAYVGGSRWRIESEFATEKGDVGLDEYETRSWAGWHHHVALCLLAGAFLLSLQQDWGERCPGSPGPIASDYLQESRTGRNIRHHLVPLLRQSIYSRLAGYDDTNDAERLSQDPAMRVVVGWQGSDRNGQRIPVGQRCG